MEKHYIILIVVLFGYIGFVLLRRRPIKSETSVNPSRRPSLDTLPKDEVQNGKLVLVSNAKQENIEKVLNEFCNLYNQELFQALPRLHKVNETNFAITFPFDIDFEIYCYFVNFLHYPEGVDRSYTVTAWDKIDSVDEWKPEYAVNKKVMIFVPDDDNDYDNVYLTAEDQMGFKIGFSVGDQAVLHEPKMRYREPEVNVSDLIGKQGKDFR